MNLNEMKILFDSIVIMFGFLTAGTTIIIIVNIVQQARLKGDYYKYRALYYAMDRKEEFEKTLKKIQILMKEQEKQDEKNNN